MAKCGKCGQVGPEVTVANIRECYNGMVKAHGEPTPKVIDNPWPPSDAQVGYVLGLQAERVMPDDWKVKYDGHQPDATGDVDLRDMDKSEVSALIGMMKLFKRKDKAATQPSWTMPAGRYALHLSEPQANIRKVGQGGDTAWYFFQVDKPTEGKWAGYTFVKRLIGGGDDGGYRKVETSRTMRDRVLPLIERDPQKAMLDYGLHTGSCGHCGRALSNPESLARGIGPICAGKMGW